jgi:hypothetical protein
MVPRAKLPKLHGLFLSLWVFAFNPDNEITCKFFASTLHTAKKQVFLQKIFIKFVSAILVSNLLTN